MAHWHWWRSVPILVVDIVFLKCKSNIRCLPRVSAISEYFTLHSIHCQTSPTCLLGPTAPLSLRILITVTMLIVLPAFLHACGLVNTLSTHCHRYAGLVPRPGQARDIIPFLGQSFKRTLTQSFITQVTQPLRYLGFGVGCKGVVG